MRHPIRRLTRSPCLALLALLSSPIAAAGLKALTPAGCFSSSETFELSNIDDFQTDGLCQEACVALKKPVMGLRGGDSCWCGDLLPAADSLVDDHDCDFDCVGFPDHKCGGDKTWTVYLTGTRQKVDNAEPSSSSSSSSSSSADATSDDASSDDPTSSATVAPAVITVSEAQTVTATAKAAPPGIAVESGSSESTGPSTTAKAGIAAGVVGGVSLCILVGGLFLFLRYRRKREAEAEYRRKADIDRFVNGDKHGSASSLADSRLDPSVMMERRQSNGSIADNQDYSRRILKVMNPDGRPA
ncbi:MAG: hypothetical protein M1815_000808 [Lichina confinis]|nr:MAG: hypothetical protein M1815_000808 [Lichina confinis]